jgi:hypothetical protein
MLVRLTSIVKKNNDFFLKEIFINPSQVSLLYEDSKMKQYLMEGAISFDFNRSTGFTKLRLEGSSGREELTVVGDPHLIEQKIRKGLQNKRQLLKG